MFPQKNVIFQRKCVTQELRHRPVASVGLWTAGFWAWQKAQSMKVNRNEGRTTVAVRSRAEAEAPPPLHFNIKKLLVGLQVCG